MSATALPVRRHSATNMFAFKRALFAALKARALQAGNPLSGVQVAYSWPGSTAEAVCVYGGGTLFEENEDEETADGNDVLPYETATIGVHVRVAALPAIGPEPVQDADAQAELILAEIADIVRSDPKFFGSNTYCRFSGGQGDYTPLDAASASIVGARITVDSYVT